MEELEEKILDYLNKAHALSKEAERKDLSFFELSERIKIAKSFIDSETVINSTEKVTPVVFEVTEDLYSGEDHMFKSHGLFKDLNSAKKKWKETVENFKKEHSYDYETGNLKEKKGHKRYNVTDDEMYGFDATIEIVERPIED